MVKSSQDSEVKVNKKSLSSYSDFMKTFKDVVANGEIIVGNLKVVAKCSMSMTMKQCASFIPLLTLQNNDSQLDRKKSDLTRTFISASQQLV